MAEEQKHPELICPITHEIFKDPVIAEDEMTYEREAIQAWFDRGNNKSPVTRATIGKTLIGNRYIRGELDKFFPGRKRSLELWKKIKTRKFTPDEFKEFMELGNFEICDSGPLIYLCLHHIKETELIIRMIDISVEQNLDMTNTIDVNKYTPIHMICHEGDDRCLDKILDVYEKQNMKIDVRDRYGWAPIEYIFAKRSERFARRIYNIYNKDKSLAIGRIKTTFLGANEKRIVVRNLETQIFKDIVTIWDIELSYNDINILDLLMTNEFLVPETRKRKYEEN